MNGNTTPQALRRVALFAIGFSERTHKMLKMVLVRYGDPRFVFEFAPMGDVEILLVNGDISHIINAVHRIRAQRPCPVVVLSTRLRDDISDAYCLLNPLSPRVFMETLHRITESLPPEPESEPMPGTVAAADTVPVLEDFIPEAPGLFAHAKPHVSAHVSTFAAVEKMSVAKEKTENKQNDARQSASHTANLLEQDLGNLDNRGGYLRDINFNDAEQVNGLYFNPEGFLSQYLCNALRSLDNKPGIIEILIENRPLVLDFVHNRWGGKFDEQALRGLCLAPLHARPEIRHLDELPEGMQPQGHVELVSAQTDFSQTQRLVHSHRTFRAEFILAQIGLWCAHGHLPKGADPHKPLRLRHWPNIICLPRTNGAMQIASLWMQTPCSLIETVERTGLLQRHVFAFYVICDILNLFVDPRAHNTNKPTGKHAGERAEKPKDKQATPVGFLRRLLQTVWKPDGEA